MKLGEANKMAAQCRFYQWLKTLKTLFSLADGGEGKSLRAVCRYHVSGKGLLIDFLSKGHDSSWGNM